jgi:hypothetical protein
MVFSLYMLYRKWRKPEIAIDIARALTLSTIGSFIVVCVVKINTYYELIVNPIHKYFIILTVIVLMYMISLFGMKISEMEEIVKNNDEIIQKMSITGFCFFIMYIALTVGVFFSLN